MSVERLRREYWLTVEEIAEKLSMARSTVAGALARLGLGRFAPSNRKLLFPAISAGASAQAARGRAWAMTACMFTSATPRRSPTVPPRKGSRPRGFLFARSAGSRRAASLDGLHRPYDMPLLSELQTGVKSRVRPSARAVSAV